MTDANFSLLSTQPFVRHNAYTLWRLEENPGGADKKPVKVPVHYDGRTRHQLGRPARHGRPAIPPNPAPPLSADLAAAWLQHHRAAGVGHGRPGEVGYLDVGFRPGGTGLVCIDLDDCLRDGKWTPGAEALMRRFPGALIELSVSGRGAHIWVTVSGEGPGRLGKQVTPLGEIEVYADGQFIAQGRILGGDACTDHTEAVAALVAEFWPTAKDAKRQASTEWADLSAEEQARVVEEIRSTFPHLRQDTYHEWTALGMALSTLGDEVGLPLWHELSELWPGYDFHTCEAKWYQLHATNTGYQALFAKAASAGTGWVNPRQRVPLPDDASQVFEVAATPGFGAGAAPEGMLLEPPASRGATADLSFLAASGGEIKPTVASIESALMGPEAGVRIAYDSFKDRISISIKDSPWRPFRDTDYGRLRAAFERRGFKAVPAETMQTAVAMVAEAHQFDSLTDWANTLQWDGVPRIDRLMPDYYGTEDTPYARAVGAYAYTTLGGRALEPGAKADMAIILVGLQGVRKTTALEVLVPEPHMFGEVDLGKDDDVIARKLRGKAVIELAEMRGFHGRDAQANKAWVSRRTEEWTPKYKEFNTTYQRRCLLVGTANDEEQLDDPTGARRFLPIKVGRVNIEALVRDREQLWAEGIARFRASGIAWEEAERLAKQEHHKFEVVDERLDRVAEFMASPPIPALGQAVSTEPRSKNPIRGVDILTGCFGQNLGQIKKSDEMALAKIMKRLGYVRDTQWIDGRAVKVWVVTRR